MNPRQKTLIALILLLNFSLNVFSQGSDILKAKSEYNDPVSANINLRKESTEPVITIQSPAIINRTSAAPPANDNCGSATSLTVNAACINGTTENGTTQGGEVTAPSCAGNTFNQTVWYSFTATNSNMYVNIDLTSFGGSGAMWSPTAWTCAVYTATGCPPPVGSLVSCKNSNSQGTGDGAIVNIMTGLVAGQQYYIQIGYRTGMGVNLIPNFCIRVGDQFTPQCNTCSNTCGPAYGFTTPPTVGQVTANPGYPQNPYIEGGQADTQCYTFIAVNDTVDFNVIVNSTCGGGNVSNFTWNLYQTSNCATVVQSGTLANLRLTGLSIGTSYTYCYSFTVPVDCYHSAYWPYFVGASPLPVKMLYFTAESEENQIKISWATASEINSDYFKLEKSYDGINFEPVKRIEAAHNSSMTRTYEETDVNENNELVYYRLTETDYDGKFETFGPIAVKQKNNLQGLNILSAFYSEGILDLKFSNRNRAKLNIAIYNNLGKPLFSKEIESESGINEIKTEWSIPSQSVYFVIVSDGTNFCNKKFIVR